MLVLSERQLIDALTAAAATDGQGTGYGALSLYN